MLHCAVVRRAIRHDLSEPIFMAQLLDRGPLADLGRPPIAIPKRETIRSRGVIFAGQTGILRRRLVARHEIGP